MQCVPLPACAGISVECPRGGAKPPPARWPGRCEAPGGAGAPHRGPRRWTVGMVCDVRPADDRGPWPPVPPCRRAQCRDRGNPQAHGGVDRLGRAGGLPRGRGGRGSMDGRSGVSVTRIHLHLNRTRHLSMNSLLHLCHFPQVVVYYRCRQDGRKPRCSHPAGAAPRREAGATANKASSQSPFRVGDGLLSFGSHRRAADELGETPNGHHYP